MSKLDVNHDTNLSPVADNRVSYPSPQPDDATVGPKTFGLKPELRFSTPIWLRKLTNAAEMNPRLLHDLAELEASNSAIVRSNVGGWHSDTNLHQLEAFKPLR